MQPFREFGLSLRLWSRDTWRFCIATRRRAVFIGIFVVVYPLDAALLPWLIR